MATLIAIGYPDESTAEAAEATAQGLAKDLLIQPDAIAVVSRSADGAFKVNTRHHAVGGGASYGMFWGLLFGILFFVPFLGMAVGAGLGAPLGKAGKMGTDKELPEQVREGLKPGPAAVFLILEQETGGRRAQARPPPRRPALQAN